MERHFQSSSGAKLDGLLGRDNHGSLEARPPKPKKESPAILDRRAKGMAGSRPGVILNQNGKPLSPFFRVAA